MKKLLSFGIIIVLVLSLCGCETKDKYPSVSECFYVNDFDPHADRLHCPDLYYATDGQKTDWRASAI